MHVTGSGSSPRQLGDTSGACALSPQGACPLSAQSSLLGAARSARLVLTIGAFFISCHLPSSHALLKESQTQWVL